MLGTTQSMKSYLKNFYMYLPYFDKVLKLLVFCIMSLFATLIYNSTNFTRGCLQVLSRTNEKGSTKSFVAPEEAAGYLINYRQ